MRDPVQCVLVDPDLALLGPVLDLIEGGDTKSDSLVDRHHLGDVRAGRDDLCQPLGVVLVRFSAETRLGAVEEHNTCLGHGDAHRLSVLDRGLADLRKVQEPRAFPAYQLQPHRGPVQRRASNRAGRPGTVTRS